MNCRQASHHDNSSFPYLGSGTITSCLAGWWRSQVRQRKDCQVKPRADCLLAVAAAVVWGGGCRLGREERGLQVIRF